MFVLYKCQQLFAVEMNGVQPISDATGTVTVSRYGLLSGYRNFALLREAGARIVT